MSDEPPIRLVPKELGSGMHLEPNDVLENAKADGLLCVVIVRQDQYGEVEVFGSDGAAEDLLLLMRGIPVLTRMR